MRGVELVVQGGSWRSLGARVEVLKVSSRSNPNSVAGAMAGVVRQSGAVEVQVIGAGALNQAVKAIAIARGYVAPSGIELICIPTFQDIEIDGESRTAIRLAIEDRQHRLPTSQGQSQGTAVAAPASIDVRSAAPAAPAAAADGASAPAPAPSGGNGAAPAAEPSPSFLRN